MDLDQSNHTLRLFVAIEVPEAIRKEIQRLQSRLQSLASGGPIKWTPQEQLHLTLRFLGAVQRGHLEDLTRCLESACRQFSPLELVAANVGFFPENRSPRVIWLGVSCLQGQLAPLADAVQASSLEYTNEAPLGQFVAHITLGRIKRLDSGEASNLVRFAAIRPSVVLGPWIAREVLLMQSQLSALGACHSKVGSFSLCGG